jgi:hypothetical protein
MSFVTAASYRIKREGMPWDNQIYYPYLMQLQAQWAHQYVLMFAGGMAHNEDLTMSLKEAARKACDLANALFEECEARGWLTELPPAGEAPPKEGPA